MTGLSRRTAVVRRLGGRFIVAGGTSATAHSHVLIIIYIYILYFFRSKLFRIRSRYRSGPVLLRDGNNMIIWFMLWQPLSVLVQYYRFVKPITMTTIITKQIANVTTELDKRTISIGTSVNDTHGAAAANCYYLLVIIVVVVLRWRGCGVVIGAKVTMTIDQPRRATNRATGNERTKAKWPFLFRSDHNLVLTITMCYYYCEQCEHININYYKLL